jgi:hypothetical protein
LKLKIANGGGGGFEDILFLPCPTPQNHPMLVSKHNIKVHEKCNN